MIKIVTKKEWTELKEGFEMLQAYVAKLTYVPPINDVIKRTRRISPRTGLPVRKYNKSK